jgi:pyruvate dehydrogenase E2 component (dihydrolipoamide acetyltransferase)
MSVEVVMPQMGESIAEGTITKWLKKVGERVERDEPLFEISTDKVDAEIPAPSAGTVKEIRAQEGDTVAVNAVVAVIDEAGNGASAPTPAASTEPVQSPAKVEPPTPQPQSTTIPQTVVPPTKVEPEKTPTTKEASTTIPTVEELRRTKSSPLVRKIANEHGIDISRIEGSGASGRVTKDDILNFIETGTPQQNIPTSAVPTVPAQQHPLVQASEGDRVEPMSAVRKKIAEHMMLSRRTSAHVTTVYEIDMTRIVRLREQHKASFLERHNAKLTYIRFIFQAVISAIQKYPIFNSQVGTDQIIYKREINLGMAVALDWGLIVPVIKHANELSIAGLARAASDLGERARSKQLKPDEVSGGTFTVTNPGVFGGLFGTPIINQPQVAILGVGAVEKRPKVITTSEGEDTIAIRSMAYFALSFDHRIIDGADAERFLSHIKQVLEAGQFTL